MCGLVGMLDYSKMKFWANSKEEFFAMLLINSMRGRDSTGVLGIRKDKKAEFIKSVGDPWDLWAYKDYDQFSNRIVTDYTAILGHGRLATKGDINSKNAHPHRRGLISLIHNGTISNFEELKKDYKTKFEVDSDLCANMIADIGVEETAKKLRGAFAFIWYDEGANLMHVLRNSERPLYLFHRAVKEQYLFSSDDAVFDYMKAKYNFTGDSQFFEAGALYSFNFENKNFEKRKLTLASTQIYYGGPNSYINPYPWGGEDYESFEDRPVYPMTVVPPEVSMKKAFLPPVTPSASPKGHIAADYSRSIGGRLAKWKIGERIIFAFSNYTERNIQNGEKVYILHGGLSTSVPIEVIGSFSGNLDELIEQGLLTGVIKNIIVSDDVSAKFVARFNVSDIKPFEMHIPDPTDEAGNEDEDEAAIVMMEEEESAPDVGFLELGDTEKISVHRFTELSRNGCSKCHYTIVPAQSKNCLIVDDSLYCPDCVSKGDFPHNG